MMIQLAELISTFSTGALPAAGVRAELTPLV